MLLRCCRMVLLICLLSGCATQQEFAVTQEFWSNKSARIGVVVAVLPTARSIKMGQQETFDLTRNDPASQDLERFLAGIDLKGINQVADGMVEYLNKHGHLARRIPGYLDLKKLPAFNKANNGKAIYAHEDYWVNKDKWHVEKAVVLIVNEAGISRTYHAGNLTGEPNGYAQITGKIVNLATNQLEWNKTVTQSIPVDDEGWDAPPKYPSLTRAINSAYAQARVLLFNHFVQK